MRISGYVAEACEVIGGEMRGILLLCDHASNRLPQEYGTLGLAPGELTRHIAYDIGAEEVARRLAASLGVPAIMTRHSRLLIDCNRGLDDPTLIMRLSDGAVIPGNRVLDASERETRVRLYYQPYHRAIDDAIDRCLAAGHVPMLISLHSFTPVWKGHPRPWHASVLWDRDDRAVRPLIAALSREEGLTIGDNEPYTGRLKGDTMWQHGTMRGLAHAIIEIRQDLVLGEDGQAEWASRLAGVLKGLLDCPTNSPDLKVIRHYGSHTDGSSQEFENGSDR